MTALNVFVLAGNLGAFPFQMPVQIEWQRNSSDSGNRVTEEFEWQWNSSDSGIWVSMHFEWQMDINYTKCRMAHEYGRPYIRVVTVYGWQTTVNVQCGWLFSCILNCLGAYVIPHATNFNICMDDQRQEHMAWHRPTNYERLALTVMCKMHTCELCDNNACYVIEAQ